MRSQVGYQQLPMELRQKILQEFLEALFLEYLAALETNNVTYAGLTSWQVEFLDQLSPCLVCEYRAPKVVIWPLQVLEAWAMRNYARHERHLGKLQDECDELKFDACRCQNYAIKRFMTRQLYATEGEAETYNQKYVLPAEQHVRLVRCMIEVLQSLSDHSSAAALRQKLLEAWIGTRPALIHS